MRTTFFALSVAFILSGCCSPSASYTDWTTPKAKSVRRSIAANPSDSGGYYSQGYAASHIKDVKTVNASYQKAIQLDPSCEWYRISYGWALFNAESYPAALKQWLSAYDFCHGNHPENNITVALGYYGTKDYERASDYYSRQAKTDKRYSDFKTLQEATAGWTWHEKEAVYRLYDIWRYSHGRSLPSKL